METYKIIDSQGNEVLSNISLPFLQFVNEVDYMRQLYKGGRYTKAEQTRDKLSEKLDDIMRDL